MEKKAAQSVIIIKKKKGHGHGHHGGSWKVAFADFMTAMMAFFLLMWLLESTTQEQQDAIAGYFKDPGSKYQIGPGGANSGVIDLKVTPASGDNTEDQIPVEDSVPDSAPPSEARILEERLQLDELQQKLVDELGKQDSVFNLLKDQILIDVTALGLRIQIVDAEHRPMFDVGSSKMKSYSTEVLHALGNMLTEVPNKISITGHTDATPYSTDKFYGNWELSADRANSARRALLGSSFKEDKIATIQGMGSAAPLRPEHPFEPINRRIAIIVLKKAVADAFATGDSGFSSRELLGMPESGSKVMSEDEVDAAIENRAGQREKN
jgi:chemotaxis protein MotB